jgi:hypothetical protein
MDEYNEIQEVGCSAKLYQLCSRISVYANGMQSLTKCLYQGLTIFLVSFVSISIFLFFRQISQKLGVVTETAFSLLSQLNNNLLQTYQDVSFFFQFIVEYRSNYFGLLFEDISMMSEQLPKKIQEEMSNVASSSIEEIYYLRDVLIS